MMILNTHGGRNNTIKRAENDPKQGGEKSVSNDATASKKLDYYSGPGQNIQKQLPKENQPNILLFSLSFICMSI